MTVGAGGASCASRDADRPPPTRCCTEPRVPSSVPGEGAPPSPRQSDPTPDGPASSSHSEHARGSEVPRLRVPDQVLGAFGARHLGRPEYWEALTGSGHVLIEDISLSPAVLQAGTTRIPGPIHDRYSGVYFHSTSVAALQAYDRHTHPGKRSTRLIRHARNGCDPADRRGAGSSPRTGAGIDVDRDIIGVVEGLQHALVGVGAEENPDGVSPLGQEDSVMPRLVNEMRKSGTGF